MLIDERKLEKAINTLPPLSPAVNKVVELASSLTASPLDLSAAIKTDPVLMTKVLKLVNSAYFGMRQEIVSLNRAIILLGVNTIKNIAFSTALLSTFSHRLSHSGFDIDSLWRHSVGVGVASKMLAGFFQVSRKEMESYFIAGLIHDIGKLLFDRFQPLKYKIIIDKIRNKGGFMFQEEKRLFSYDHAQLGDFLCKKWRIGEDFQKAVRNHHNIENNDGMTDIVKTADAFVNNLTDFSTAVGGNNIYDDSILKKFSVNRTDLSIIFRDFEEQFQKATVFVRGEINGSKNLG